MFYRASLCSIFCSGGPPGLFANKSHLNRSISSLLLSLDKHPVVGEGVDSKGNTFFVFKKT